HPTIEGANGIGKTSLVAVAGYRALVRHRNGETGQLFLPLPRPFQLTSGNSPDEFKRRVYLEIAQGFIAFEGELRRANFDFPDSGAINAWLNTPPGRPVGIGLSSPYGGGSASVGQPAASSGFDDSGFFITVERWLRECFRSRDAGGFICLIDNLEI